MRTSNFLLATLREDPADAEVISHKLMLRAGMIRKLTSGIYTWLPLGLRVLKKVEKIIREEMNRIGALEVLMPTVQPAELWQESKRWDTFDDQLLKIKDRNQHDFCFGPTHEEIVTDLIRHELHSYKQLPLIFYQIQTKFRDEIRPRFGVMRGREFMMKDAYSFHLDEDSLAKTYAVMYEAYEKIFSRLGLKFRSVLADTGNIGGSKSHEFQVLADSGEDLIVYSDASDYAANIEMATCLTRPLSVQKSSNAMKKVATPKVTTVAEVADFLKVPTKQILRTLIVRGEKTPWVALVLRGDHELNEIKANKLQDVSSPLTFINPKEFQETLGYSAGFVGPLGLTFSVILDHDAAQVTDFICGANVDDEHLINVNWERDLPLPKIADLRKVVEGDLSPDSKGKLKFVRGIEVGQVFQLGQKYSKSMRATVLDKTGKAVELFMGCYGIGVSRTIAAAIEQHHDEHGIVWQDAMTPFQLVIIPMSLHKSYRVRELTEKIYQELTDHGFEVLLDDREERAGVLFTDMDLVGIPHRIVISESGIDVGVIEYKSRAKHDSENVSIDNLMEFITSKIVNID
ncbi:MAG: proline--tRNA ligase [Coxiellaceae bacterium]|jgi:prolyl-tRNA synthetase|nr:proline--tRNA ligase [Coxiellaceae bacterium]